MISNRDDTEKVLEANEAGIPIVRPEWIYKSVRSWTRLDPESFIINPKKPTKPYRSRRQKRRLEETFENEGDDLIAPPIVFDASELDEINKELRELDDDDDDDEDEEDDDSQELENGFFSETSSAGKFDDYPGTNSESQYSDRSLDELEESLF